MVARNFYHTSVEQSKSSRNLTQKSHHGSVLRAVLPSNKQWIIRWDKEAIFRGINYRGFKILTVLSVSEAGME